MAKRSDNQLMEIAFMSGEPVAATLSLILALVLSLALAIGIIGSATVLGKSRSQARNAQEIPARTGAQIVIGKRGGSGNRGGEPVLVPIPTRRVRTGPFSTNPPSLVRVVDASVDINRNRLPGERGEQR